MIKILTAVSLVLSFFFGSLEYSFTPTLVFDASENTDKVGSYASGYLYGLAENGVPDAAAAESLDISSVSQKVIDGLQHPTGDIDHVSPMLDGTDYMVVYLQDSFSTWYYEHENIFEMRKNGEYDMWNFLENTYFPLVKEKVEALKDKPYHEKIVYCLFNECDNGIWFGTWKDGWTDFDDAGRQNFYKAWKMTYNYVLTLDPDAVFGGPGYFEYNSDKIKSFLSFCKENNCLPDILIYHELSELSSLNWDLDVQDKLAIEDELGIDHIPVIVTEYGTMEECGNPSKMFPYILQTEATDTYGNIAFWRLADNLNDNLADSNVPNSCWWLYRWYADMEGNFLTADTRDLFHGDFGKAVKQGRQMRFKYLKGFGSITDEKDEIDLLIGGADYEANAVIKNISSSKLGKKVNVKVEAVTFEGLGGAVYKPYEVKNYNAFITGNRLKINLGKLDSNFVYHVVITPADVSIFDCKCGDAGNALPARYEFENGTLIGSSYTYDSAYATTGEIAGMVGGMENDGDGVETKINIPESGLYTLTFIYGKGNDGAVSADRKAGKAKFLIDGAEEIITLPNTIKSEYTSSINKEIALEKGEHTIRFEHCDGTFVLDSMLVKKAEGQNDTVLLKDSDRSVNGITSYLAVSPCDGYFEIETDAPALSCDGSEAEPAGDYIRLRRGFNFVDLQGSGKSLAISASDYSENTVSVTPEDMRLNGSAFIKSSETGESLSGITSGSGAAAFTVSAPQAGAYRITFTYSNNEEGGYHAYNVDLIEEYFTLTVNGENRTVMCRNTYADDNLNTVTVNVNLTEGINKIAIFNDGSVKFADRPCTSPDLYLITVSKLNV